MPTMVGGNATQSDIIAIGQTHHRVVGLAVITRQEDPASQRHEIWGVENLYKYFDEHDISVNTHGHYRNAIHQEVTKEMKKKSQSILRNNKLLP